MGTWRREQAEAIHALQALQRAIGRACDAVQVGRIVGPGLIDASAVAQDAVANYELVLLEQQQGRLGETGG